MWARRALAVQWAHQVANRFPGGQVYVDLQGYSSGPAVTPDQALAPAIRAFGVTGEDIPLQQDAMVGMYRSITSGKRLLVMVDNAPSAAHVRPLVPGGPGCMTVVTSRDRLAGLAARDGAHRLKLGVRTFGVAGSEFDSALARLTQHGVPTSPSRPTPTACGTSMCWIRMATACRWPRCLSLVRRELQVCDLCTSRMPPVRERCAAGVTTLGEDS